MPSGSKRRRAPSSGSNNTLLRNAKRRMNSKELSRKFNILQNAQKQSRIQKKLAAERLRKAQLSIFYDAELDELMANNKFDLNRTDPKPGYLRKVVSFSGVSELVKLAIRNGAIAKELESEFEANNKQLKKYYGLIEKKGSITDYTSSVLKQRLNFADTQFNGMGSVARKMRQEIEAKYLVFKERSTTIDYIDLTASKTLSRELMPYLPVIKEIRQRGTMNSLRVAYDLAMQIQRCSHIDLVSPIRIIPSRPTDKYNDRLLASIITERGEKEHEDRQAKYDAWNAMGKALADADENLRNSVMEERVFLEHELHYVLYDRLELEDRARAMKIQDVDEWYPESHEAFMKALMVKNGEKYMQQRLAWRVNGATFNPELDREEGIE